MLKILFRTDASSTIGSGHISRCMALAKGLRRRGHNVEFASRDGRGNLNEWVESQNFRVHRLNLADDLKDIGASGSWFNTYDWEADVRESKKIFNHDYLVLDHYGLDERWQKEVAPAKNHVVIDDLANRKFACNILINQNSLKTAPGDYAKLVPANCKVLLGPTNSLFLNDERFLAARKNVQVRESAKRVLCFFGGSDPTHLTLQFIQAYEQSACKIQTTVLCGSMNMDAEKIKEICSRVENLKFSKPIDDMAAMLLNHDVAIGSGGVNSWERAFLGIPSLVLRVSDNQSEIIESLVLRKAVIDCGDATAVSWENVLRDLKQLINNPLTLSEMSRSALAIWPDDVTNKPYPGIEIMEEYK